MKKYLLMLVTVFSCREEEPLPPMPSLDNIFRVGHIISIETDSVFYDMHPPKSTLVHYSQEARFNYCLFDNNLSHCGMYLYRFKCDDCYFTMKELDKSYNLECDLYIYKYDIKPIHYTIYNRDTVRYTFDNLRLINKFHLHDEGTFDIKYVSETATEYAEPGVLSFEPGYYYTYTREYYLINFFSTVNKLQSKSYDRALGIITGIQIHVWHQDVGNVHLGFHY